MSQLSRVSGRRRMSALRVVLSAVLGLACAHNAAPAGSGGTDALVPGGAGVLSRVANAVDGAESRHGADPKMWRSPSEGPQGPMQVSAAAATDVGGGDRFDEKENRALGRAYLALLYRRFGSWPDAVAAYNWGPGHMNSWVGSGRPIDKLPPQVAHYEAHVLMASGLPISAPGEEISRRINARLERLGLLRLQARREFLTRLRRAGGRDPVELLYTEIMHATNSALRRRADF